MSLDALKGHLFEAIEGVKNLNDPNADECEKMSLEQAKVIAVLSSKIVDIYKTQLGAAIALSDKLDKPERTMLIESGIVSER